MWSIIKKAAETGEKPGPPPEDADGDGDIASRLAVVVVVVAVWAAASCGPSRMMKSSCAVPQQRYPCALSVAVVVDVVFRFNRLPARICMQSKTTIL